MRSSAPSVRQEARDDALPSAVADGRARRPHLAAAGRARGSPATSWSASGSCSASRMVAFLIAVLESRAVRKYGAGLSRRARRHASSWSSSRSCSARSFRCRSPMRACRRTASCRRSPTAMSISSAARRCSRRPFSSITASARFRPGSRRSACGGFSAKPGTARSSPSRSTQPPIRPKSCAAPSKACRKGQWEGAASLGLHKLQTLWKIVLPQALIVALRPYGNEIILMIKGSAIVADHHRLRPDGRDPPRLFAHLRFPDLHLGRASSIWRWSRCCATRVEWIERRITRHLKR